jgi:Plasmid pRiA4b ORF-3-like protein/SEC-C motif
MSFNDYLDRQTGDDLNPAGSGQWRGFSGYATGATARSKQALVPAAWLQFPYLPRDQYELGLEAGLLDATYPLNYTDYLRTVEDVLRTHIREYKVRLIPLTIAGLREFATVSGLDPARRSTRMAYLNAMGADAPVLPWPPGRNAGCWCGSGIKYKKCCGSPGFTQTPVPDRARCVLRIEVDGEGPGGARRVAVPSELRTDKLRDALNRALGLDGDPLYRFEIDGGHVSDPRAADDGDVQTADQVTLSVLANEPGHSFTYHHDLDHDRACIVVVEEITAVDPAGNDVVVFGDEPRPDRSSQG